MDRQTINRTIQNYMREVEQSIREPIVYRELGRMPLDEVKAFFLLLPMLNGESWTGAQNTSAIAVGAVHAAFDVHDRVDVFDASSKEQQLMVLSGDHFSGIHYRLLSSLPDFAFISSMSQMIGSINETKTDLLMEMREGDDELVESILRIESGCIREFYCRYGFRNYAKIAETAIGLIWFCSKLKNPENVNVGWTAKVMKKADVESAISKLASRLQKELAEAGFLMPFLKQEIHRMATPLLEKPI